MDKGKNIRMSENGYCGSGTDTERSKVRILLCDSSAETCREVLSVLCRLSYQVIAVCSDSQIFDALNAGGPHFDIILASVDLLMVNGAEILRYIMHHKEFQDIPVIMLLTKDQVSVTINGLRLGATDFLVKPLQAEELATLWTYIYRRRNEALEGCSSRLGSISF